MNHLLRRRLETSIRVHGFGITYAEFFPVGSRGAELFALLAAAIIRVQARAAQHDSDAREIRRLTAAKNVARRALLALLEAINLTTGSLAFDSPGLKEKFRMPQASPAQDLLRAARSFLANATPLKALFIREELPADFLEELSTAITTFEKAIDETNRTKGAKVGAHTSQDEDLAEAMRIVQKLDVIVRNKFKGNAAVLADWISSSHVERHSARHSALDDRSTPPAASPASDEPSSGRPSGS